MKTVAFVIGLVVIVVGAAGIVAPSGLVWISRRFVSPAEWYALAAVRVAFGVILFVVAKTSRMPKTLRFVALVPIVAGLAIPFVGVDRARATVDWLSLQGPATVRFSSIPVLALGGFVAYACAPSGRAP